MELIGNKLMEIISQLLTGIVKEVGIATIYATLVAVDIAGNLNEIVVMVGLASIHKDVVVVAIANILSIHNDIVVVVPALYDAIGPTSQI